MNILFENLKLKVKNLSVVVEREGQSLVEILIALTLGALLIGAASAGIVVILRSGVSNERIQSATVFARDFLEKARPFAEADWSNISTLKKGSSTAYFFNSSGTLLMAVEGIEGVIDNDVRDNLVAYWLFDEATGTVAYDVAGDYDGTIFNALRATSSCQISSCLSFDGSGDRVSASTISDLDTGKISVSVWFNSVSSTGARQSVVSIGENSSTGAVLAADNNDGNIHFWIRDSAAGWVDVTYPVNFGEWLHVVGTYDGSVLSLYINGVLKNTKSLTGSMLTPTSDTSIGSRNSDDMHWFNGKIDDVRIYNRALNAEEIKGIYNATVFKRHFYVEDVCRTNDANYNISGTYPCSAGEVKDPSTQKVTAVVEWGTSSPSKFSLSDYVTRWKNEVFRQTDWSGGAVGDIVITEPTNTYASSSNIATSTGFFKIKGL